MTSSSDETTIRQSIIDACIEMNRVGINQGTSGNISVRYHDGILITPTSLPYDTLAPQDIMWMGFDGRIEGDHAPSSEWRFHLDITRTREDVNAVVHAHPPYATTLAIMGRGIPPVHYMIAVAGSTDIRCAPYATFGSAELSTHALAALDGRQACLLAHHGMIAVSSSLGRAMWLAVEVETLARQYHGALLLGEPPLLPVEEIERVIAKMAGYGHAKS